MATDPWAEFKPAPADDPWAEFQPAEAAAAPADTGFSVKKMVTNIPRSGLQLLGGVAQAVLNPIDTAYGLAEAGAGGMLKALPESARQSPALQTVLGSPEAQQELIAKANALGGFYADRYGSTDKLLRTIEQDPVGFVSDISVVLGGTGAALKAGGATTAGARVAQAGATIDPVLQTARGVGVTGRAIQNVASGPLQSAGQFISAPFRRPETTAANVLAQIYDNNPAAAINMLQQTQNLRTTPGYALTMAERSLAAGERNPTLASVQDVLARAEGPVNRMVSAGEDVRVKALQDQLARVEAQITQQRSVLAPQALADLQRVSDDIRAQLGAQQNALLQQQRAATATLPEAQLRERGTAITERAGELKRQVKEGEIDPAYAAAFKEAGGAGVDVSNVIGSARTIINRPLSQLAPETAPETAAVLRRFQARGTPAQPAKYDAVGMQTTPEVPAVPPTASLKELDDVRKAINRDIATAKAAGDATTLRNLYELHRSIDNAVQGSTALSDTAKSLYATAVEKYRTEFAPRFKTGQTERLFRQSSLGETQLMPSRVAVAFLRDADSANQFVTTFGKDATAAAAMQDAIAGLYRRKVEQGGVKAGDKFLEQYGPQLDVLERAGVNARSALGGVRQQLQQIEAGQTALQARARLLKHTDVEGLVNSMLGSPTKMKEGLAALTAQGRDALVKNIFDRAALNADAGKPAEALSFLTKYETTIKQAAGARAYDEAVASMKAQIEAADVAKDLPDAGNLSQVVVDLKPNLSTADLTDLQVLAEDLARRKDMEILAGRGTTGKTPDVARLATEGAEAGHAGTLSIPIAATKDILRALGKTANTKAAQQLAHWMYKDPDAAIAALEKVAARRAKTAAIRGPVRAAVGATRRAVGQAVVSPVTRIGAANALAQEQERRNALAP